MDVRLNLKSDGLRLYPVSDESLLYIQSIQRQEITVIVEGEKLEKHRTLTQNAAMHLYFQMLADSLNDAGLDMKKVLKPEVDIPWTKDSIKNYLWRPIQKAMTKKESTTELDTVNPSEIYKVLDRHLSEKFGVSVEWPSLR